MTFDRTFNKALKKNDLPVDFPDWNAIAQDRVKWRTTVFAKETIFPILLIPPPPTQRNPTQRQKRVIVSLGPP